MFFAIILIAIGAALLFNAIIPIGASFWGIFWGIIFLAVGFKMVRDKGCCSKGNGAWWNEKFGGKMNDESCDCGHIHEEVQEAKTRKQK
jgi:hypothetical protein